MATDQSAAFDIAQGLAPDCFRKAPLSVRPLTPIFGAEIQGATDIQDNPAWLARTVNQLWGQYGILLFRDAPMSEARQTEFSAMFGPLEIHGRREFNSPTHPELFYVTNRRDLGLPEDGLSNDELNWHSDQSYLPRPALGSLLLAVDVPTAGGDTWFADCAAAYDRLPPVTRARIANLRAIHDHNKVTQKHGMQINAFQTTRSSRIESHPIVRTHPITQRKSLYLAETVVTHIEGLNPAESEALLAELYDAMIAPELIYCHRWRAGDSILWDNARVIHRRDAFPPDQIRFMRRTTIRPPAEVSIPF
jgi:taurine dioxygenase